MLFFNTVVIVSILNFKEMSTFEERPTQGMPDMMPKGTVDNPPQKEPQDIPEKMVEQPYDKEDDNKEVPLDPDKKDPDKIDPPIGDPEIKEPKAEDEDFGVC